MKPKLLRKIEAKASWLLKKPSRLRGQLIKDGRTRWLDLGGSSFSEGFCALNLHSSDQVPEEFKSQYFQNDVLKMDSNDFAHLGLFDLIRMQHVFEHFSLEESQIVLNTCSRLLKTNGYLLISVPDLQIHIQSYLDGYKWMRPFVDFAHTRIPLTAPSSFLFGLHVHQGGYAEDMEPGDAHKWCYDFEGLKFQIERSGVFDRVRYLGLLHPDANIPFSHNRPHEDLCVLAQKV